MLNMIYWPLSGIVLILIIIHRIRVCVCVYACERASLSVDHCVRMHLLDARAIKCAAIISFRMKNVDHEEFVLKWLALVVWISWIVTGFGSVSCRFFYCFWRWSEPLVQLLLLLLLLSQSLVFFVVCRACCAAKWCPVFTTHYGCGLSYNKLYVSFFII